MAPAKRKCCIPYCSNILGVSNKNFFKLTSNNNNKDIENWLKTFIDKSYAASRSPKLGGLYSCEDHYDLPNDTENLIRYKYLDGTKLKLRNGVLPEHKIPFQVCRVCLQMIYTDDEYVDITEDSPQHTKDVFSTCLPEIDLSLTTPTMSCMSCFKAATTFYALKLKALTSEITVVNCKKAVDLAAEKVKTKIANLNLLHYYDTVKYIFEQENGEQLEDATTHDEDNVTKENVMLTKLKNSMATLDHVEIVEVDDEQLVDDVEEEVNAKPVQIEGYTSDETTSESEDGED